VTGFRATVVLLAALAGELVAVLLGVAMESALETGAEPAAVLDEVLGNVCLQGGDFGLRRQPETLILTACDPRTEANILTKEIEDKMADPNRILLHSQSHALQLRAEGLFPGGVNSPVRGFRSVGGDPPFVARAEGAYLYDADGNHLRMIGEQGLNPGSFALPKGIAADREGRIYVVDAATQVVQLFDSEGRILMYFGNPNTSGPGSTDLPAGIAVDYDHLKFFQQYAAPGFKVEYLIFVTNQYGDQKVSVYGFGHKK